MDRMLRLSIIVPVYNVERYLEECVVSLYQQDIPVDDYEVILINDGSTDGSYDLAKRLTSTYKNIRLFSQENQGQSVARNKGLDVAKGKYIMFVDSDDGLFSNVLGKLISIAEINKLDVCAYRIKYFDENDKAHNGSIQPFPVDKVYDGRYAVTHGADIGAVWLNLYSSKMLERYHLRFLEGIYHQDVDFNLRMYAYADRMMFTETVAYNYRYVPGSSTRKPNKKRQMKLINDDLTVVRHIRDFSEADERGRALRGFYTKHGNSLLVSCLMSILKEKNFSIEDKLALFETAKKLKIYPIKGCTMSWLSSAMIPFLNKEWLYRTILRIKLS